MACTTCNGTGWVSYGEGYYDDDDDEPCENCWRDDPPHCPRCDSAEVQFRNDEEAARCLNCAWDSTEHDDIPF